MLRVKNEERRITACLASIVSVFDEIVVVDNGSTDRTAELLREFVEESGHKAAIRLFSYPFAIARCGEEHAATPEDSVHSLAYYYNWCLSRCTHAHVFKWDADMLLIGSAAGRLAAHLDALPRLTPTLISVPIQTVYRDQAGEFYAAVGEINQEPRVFTNMAAIRFRKGDHWEVLRPHLRVEKLAWSEVMVYEIKDTGMDEFSNWTSRDFPTERKQREWRNFNLVRSGRLHEGEFEKVEIGSGIS